jgi:hypothetical protein
VKIPAEHHDAIVAAWVRVRAHLHPSEHQHVELSAFHRVDGRHSTDRDRWGVGAWFAFVRVGSTGVGTIISTTNGKGVVMYRLGKNGVEGTEL